MVVATEVVMTSAEATVILEVDSVVVTTIIMEAAAAVLAAVSRPEATTATAAEADFHLADTTAIAEEVVTEA